MFWGKAKWPNLSRFSCCYAAYWTKTATSNSTLLILFCKMKSANFKEGEYSIEYTDLPCYYCKVIIWLRRACNQRCLAWGKFAWCAIILKTFIRESWHRLGFCTWHTITIRYLLLEPKLFLTRQNLSFHFQVSADHCLLVPTNFSSLLWLDNIQPTAYCL